MNFQVTVLKILVSYPDGFAVMEDLKRDMSDAEFDRALRQAVDEIFDASMHKA